MGTLAPQFGSIIPSQSQQLLQSNYLQFNTGTGKDFAQQYLPEIYEQEVERYGNRTLSGFLRMVGAEMPMTSDQVIWSEQNRLHIAYNDCTNDGVTGIQIGNIGGTSIAGTLIQNVISPGQTIVILDDLGAELKAIVTSSHPNTGALVVAPYTAADTSSISTVTDAVKIFVYGSEFNKGSQTSSWDGSAGAITGTTNVSIDPTFTQFSNSPVIIRNGYTINGSDMSQIGWVEVATEDGTSGYLWYLKAESETRLRFEDYLEMSVVEGELASATAAGSANAAGFKGTQGLFAAVGDRGNVEVAFSGNNLDDFDAILSNLDTQGAIEENMLFLNRATSLEIDGMLAGVSAGAQGGTAYGLFENSEEMALNLGFSGFRRGSYDFYKTDWKYLNDFGTRGQFGDIEGALIPAGTSTVYDQDLGKNIKRPFLHIRYRSSETDDRKMKTWITGSVGGAYTSDVDEMRVNFLSERCLITQGANNFFLLKD